MRKPLALLVILLVGTTALAEDISAEHLSPSRKPGQNFNLSKFKLQLPVAHGSGVVEIPSAQLTTYTSEYFYTDKTTGAMVFWVPTDGAHTSGSKFPRTELRQNTDFNISTGSTSLTVTMAVLQTPKRNNIVVGQLKGENEQPIELRWNRSGRLSARNELSCRRRLPGRSGKPRMHACTCAIMRR